MEKEIEGDTRWSWPATVMLVGSSGTGKSFLLERIVMNTDAIFNAPVDHIFYIYNDFQSQFSDMEKANKKLKFFHLFDHPEIENIHEYSQLLLILDDCADLHKDKTWVRDWHIRKSHHQNQSIISVYHGLYNSNIPFFRLISLNTQITIFLNSPRSQDQIAIFARQCFTGNSRNFLAVYNEIMRKKYGYLCVNFQPGYDYRLRLMTNFIPPDEPPMIFIIDEKK